MISAVHKLLLTKLVCAPVLLLQGKWVKFNIVKLPEPKQNQSGHCGVGPTLKVMLLGDSSAAGVGVSEAQHALLGQLLYRLSDKYSVNYQMMAKSGKTTVELIGDIEQVDAENIDVVITALGVNDVTNQVPVKLWEKQQRQLIELIQQKFSPDKIIMSGLPPVGDFPALPWPLSAYMGLYADVLNETLQTITAQFENVLFHSLRNYPAEAQPAIDGFHPGAKVYELWAQNLSDEIKRSC